MPHPAVSNPKQSDFLVIPDAPFAYWLQGKLLKIIKENKKLSSISLSRAGLTTGDSLRFIRYFWEIRNFNKYLLLAHGGSYQKWVGRQYSYLKWGDKFWVLCSLGNNLPSREYYYQPMFALSQAARGCLGARYISGAAFTNTSIVTIPYNQVHVDTISLLLNSRISSYYIRIISQKIGFEAGHFDVLSLPTHPLTISHKAVYLPILDLKQALIATDLTERSFSGVVTDQPRLEAVAATLHTLEGMNEREVFAAYGVAGSDMQAVLDETGIPAGWFPLIQGYDALQGLSITRARAKIQMWTCSSYLRKLWSM